MPDRGLDTQPLARRVEELVTLYELTDALYRSKTLSDVFDAGLAGITRVLGDRASILLFDADGAMQFVAWRGLSDSYRRRLAGHTPWHPGQHDPDPIFVADIRDSGEPDRIKDQILAEGIFGLAFIPLLVGGNVVGKFMTYYREPHAFDDDERRLALTIARQIGFSIDRFRSEEARRATELELRETEERFRLMSEEAPVMIWMSDGAGRCLHLNAMLRAFWGVAPEDVASFDWRTSMHPADRDRITAEMVAATAGRRAVSIEGRYRDAEGTYRMLRTNARPRFSAGGAFLGMIGVNIDITERKRSEAQRELLLAELNHRVKNTLAVVQGIAHQTFGKDAAKPEAQAAFEGRLLALSNAHSLLISSNWENTDLERLTTDTFSAQAVDRDRYRISGPVLRLPARQSLSLSLALHELCTNAVKYGALSNDTGRVEVAWRLDPADHGTIAFSWREIDGPPVSPPSRQGFGSRLITRVLAEDLNGEASMNFEPSGLVYTIVAPLPG